MVESVDNNQQLPVSASAVAKSALNDIDGFGAINDELRFVHSRGQAADLEAHFRCHVIVIWTRFCMCFSYTVDRKKTYLSIPSQCADVLWFLGFRNNYS